MNWDTIIGRGWNGRVGEPVSIERDPFARGNVVRRVVETREGCAWCGQRRKGGKSLFQYGWDSDGGRLGWLPRLFCSRECCRSFHH